MRISKRDIGYSVYSRIEEAVRTWVRAGLLNFGNNWLDRIPVGILEKVQEREPHIDIRRTTDPLDILDASDWPDLAQIVTYRKAFSHYLPHNQFTQSEFENRVEKAYLLRNKIAHVRQSFTAIDLDLLIEIANDFKSILGPYAADLSEILQLVDNSPENIVVTIPADFFISDEAITSCPHNLPPSDYDPDGGFIGRKEDVTKLRSLVLGNLDRVITISGAGGVGKTALAHKFCRLLIEKSPAPFDAIIWISAKEEILTLTGIEPIEPMVRNYDDMIDTIFDVYGFDSVRINPEQRKEHLELILGASQQGFLLIVDNLETIQDERIINFIKNIPPPNKVLITSRMGLGEVERRYLLKELSKTDAIALIRTVAREKGATSLVQLPDNLLHKYAQRMSSYPLVIKWVVGQVALGRDIDKLVNDLSSVGGNIAKFSFDHIYDHLLDDEARLVLCCLAASDTPLTRGVLTHVSGLQPDILDEALRDLTLASLVLPEHERGDDNVIVTRYSLLTLTVGYLRGKLQAQPRLWQTIKTRMELAGSRIEEATRAGKQYRYALQDLGATTDEERIAATWALTAYQRSQIGDYEGAVEAFNRATDIAPNFARIYRNWATVESSTGYHARANELMEKATKLSKDDPTLWFTWGQIEKRRNRLDNARQHFQTALELSPNDGAVLSALGDIEQRTDKFSEADSLYHRALKFPPSETRRKRHELITQTAIAHNSLRWAESLERNGALAEAKQKALNALQEAKRAVAISSNDERSVEVLQEIQFQIAKILLKTDGFTQAESYLLEAAQERPRRGRAKIISAWAFYYLAENLVKLGRYDEAERFLRKGQKLIWAVSSPQLTKLYNSLRQNLKEEVLTGRIYTVNEHRGYGLIERDDNPSESVFLHISYISPGVTNQEFKMLEGKHVQFQIKQTEKGPQAINVQLITNAFESS